MGLTVTGGTFDSALSRITALDFPQGSGYALWGVIDELVSAIDVKFYTEDREVFNNLVDISCVWDGVAPETFVQNSTPIRFRLCGILEFPVDHAEFAFRLDRTENMSFPRSPDQLVMTYPDPTEEQPEGEATITWNKVVLLCITDFTGGRKGYSTEYQRA